MAVPASKSALSVGQRLWNSLSAWAVKSAGYQKYGMIAVYENLLAYKSSDIGSARAHPLSTALYYHIPYLAGLRREDLYMEEDPVVAEALRRLPQEEKELRLWRLKRALDLSMKKNILPKEQWTSEEEVCLSSCCIFVSVISACMSVLQSALIVFVLAFPCPIP